jgi:hypothetical protein
VVPVKTVDEESQGYVNKDVMYNNLMKKFSFRNFDDPDVYYDENYYRFSANARDKFAKLAQAYLEDGNKQRAKEVIDYCFKVLPESTVPYDYFTPQFIGLMAQVGEEKRAKELLEAMAKDSQQEIDYFLEKGSLFDQEIQSNLYIMQQLMTSAQEIGMQERALQLQQQFMQYLQRIRH